MIKNYSGHNSFRIRMPNSTPTPLYGERTLKFSSLNHGINISHRSWLICFTNVTTILHPGHIYIAFLLECIYNSRWSYSLLGRLTILPGSTYFITVAFFTSQSLGSARCVRFTIHTMWRIVKGFGITTPEISPFSNLVTSTWLACGHPCTNPKMPYFEHSSQTGPISQVKISSRASFPSHLAPLGHSASIRKILCWRCCSLSLS